MVRLPIPARSGAFAHLRPGQLLKIINTHGTQVVDTWAFASLVDDATAKSDFRFRYLSMCHTRSALSKLTLSPNDTLRDNTRQPMLTLTEDTSGGVHCVLFAACDSIRYEQLGVQGFHDSCVNNLGNQLDNAASFLSDQLARDMQRTVASARLVARNWTPDPLNLFMNLPVTALEDGTGGNTRLAAPTCPPGGHVVFRAELECMVVMSACPMDLTSIYENKGAEFEVLEA